MDYATKDVNLKLRELHIEQKEMLYEIRSLKAQLETERDKVGKYQDILQTIASRLEQMQASRFPKKTIWELSHEVNDFLSL